MLLLTTVKYGFLFRFNTYDLIMMPALCSIYHYIVEGIQHEGGQVQSMESIRVMR
jgi:hypothetical protein